MIKAINAALVQLDASIQRESKITEKDRRISLLRKWLNVDSTFVSVEEPTHSDEEFFYNEEFLSPFSIALRIGLHNLFKRDVTHLIFIRNLDAVVYEHFPMCAFNVASMQPADPEPFLEAIRKVDVSYGIRLALAEDSSEQGRMYAVSQQTRSTPKERKFLDSMREVYPKVFDLL